MADPRPIQSAMPEQAAAIGNSAIAPIRAELDRVWTEIVGLGGDGAENDALSALSQLAAFAASQFMARLVIAKGIPEQQAWTHVVVDLQLRLQGILAQAKADRSGGTLQ